METTQFESLKRYVKKKGIGFFLSAPAEERKALEGIIFFEGIPKLSALYLILES